MENIDITLLKPHPKNIDIYGKEDIKELSEKIKESGWIKPLVINMDNVVISGHRRLKACKLLGINDIPYERISFTNENEELERLLLENQSRDKTNYQKTQEAKFWEEVIKEKARLRKLSNLKNQTTEVEKFPPRKNDNVENKDVENSPHRGQEKEIGKTRDIVAEKVGFGSGKTYAEAKKVADKIDELKEEGNTKDSEFLEAVMNESVNGAKNLVNEDLTQVDETLKDKVINKQMTAKEAVKEIKKVIDNKDEGKEIKIDKEKIKAIDIQKIIESVKDTDKNINNTDENSLTMEVCCNVDKFKENITMYIDFEEHFEDMSKENKIKIKEHIDELEDVLNRIKGFLF